MDPREGCYCCWQRQVFTMHRTEARAISLFMSML